MLRSRLTTMRGLLGSLRLARRSMSFEQHNKHLPRMLKIQNGEKVKPTFSAGEMERRLNMLRTDMEKRGIDACVLTSYQAINYFSDFMYTYFGRPFALVVTADKSTSVTPKVDYGQPYRRTFGDNVTYTDWHKDNYFYVINQLAGEQKTIGLEYDHVHLVNMDKFKEALPKSSFVDVGESTMEMRLIKSSEEIEHIRQGAAVCDIGGEYGRDAIREGIPEYEVTLAGTQAMVREIAKRYPHAELMDTFAWFQTGLNTDGGHIPVTSREVQKGDVMSLNMFSMIAGYYTALERSMFFDHVPTDRHMELWETNVKVHCRGMELIQPGARCCDVTNELNELYLEKDMLKYRTFGYGHSFGVMGHYYGREAGLEFREDVETVIQPNMVVSMEPMITVPEGEAGAGGYREHNILVVTETGNENITHFPFGPEHNIIKQ